MFFSRKSMICLLCFLFNPCFHGNCCLQEVEVDDANAEEYGVLTYLQTEIHNVSYFYFCLQYSYDVYFLSWLQI